MSDEENGKGIVNEEQQRPAQVEYSVTDGHTLTVSRKYQSEVVQILRTFLFEAGFYEPITFEIRLDARRERVPADPYSGISISKRGEHGIAVYLPIRHEWNWRFALWLHPPRTQLGLTRDQIYEQLERAIPQWNRKYIPRRERRALAETIATPKNSRRSSNPETRPAETAKENEVRSTTDKQKLGEDITSYYHAALVPKEGADPCGYFLNFEADRQVFEACMASFPDIEEPTLRQSMQEVRAELESDPDPARGIEPLTVGPLRYSRLRDRRWPVRIAGQAWRVLRWLELQLPVGSNFSPPLDHDRMQQATGLNAEQCQRALKSLADAGVIKLQKGNGSRVCVTRGTVRQLAGYPASPYRQGVMADLDRPETWSALDKLFEKVDEKALERKAKQPSQRKTRRVAEPEPRKKAAEPPAPAVVVNLTAATSVGEAKLALARQALEAARAFARQEAQLWRQVAKLLPATEVKVSSTTSLENQLKAAVKETEQKLELLRQAAEVAKEFLEG